MKLKLLNLLFLGAFIISASIYHYQSNIPKAPRLGAYSSHNYSTQSVGDMELLWEQAQEFEDDENIYSTFDSNNGYYELDIIVSDGIITEDIFKAYTEDMLRTFIKPVETNLAQNFIEQNNLEELYKNFLQNEYSLYTIDNYTIHLINQDDAKNLTIAIDDHLTSPETIATLQKDLRTKNFIMDKVITGGQRDLIIYTEIFGELEMEINLELLGNSVEKVSIASNYYNLEQELSEYELTMINNVLLKLGLNLTEINEVVALLDKILLQQNIFETGTIGNFKYELLTATKTPTFKFSIEK
ncbi:hypothetical protein AN641_09280 [Candidatus Epulonipiscioides gigas]|nr:hypothetical protein AN641_09280 [Epulopiscium sp. SCG-C07WGA-EpuloA2]